VEGDDEGEEPPVRGRLETARGGAKEDISALLRTCGLVQKGERKRFRRVRSVVYLATAIANTILLDSKKESRDSVASLRLPPDVCAWTIGVFPSVSSLWPPQLFSAARPRCATCSNQSELLQLLNYPGPCSAPPLLGAKRPLAAGPAASGTQRRARSPTRSRCLPPGSTARSAPPSPPRHDLLNPSWPGPPESWPGLAVRAARLLSLAEP
jgi:hypothetical protein